MASAQSYEVNLPDVSTPSVGNDGDINHTFSSNTGKSFVDKLRTFSEQMMLLNDIKI